jgi:2-hydroxyglutarate dehydrogenase
MAGLEKKRGELLNSEYREASLIQRLLAPGIQKSSMEVCSHSLAQKEMLFTSYSGFYYPPDSLKTRLCLRGRRLLYEYCDEHAVPYRKTGKLVVGHSHQQEYLQTLHNKAQRLPWPSAYGTIVDPSKIAAPTKLISGDEAREMEPDLSPDISLALFSPETGIIDSHALMGSLEKDIGESDSGSVVYSTRVVRVDPYDKQPGWVVQVVTENGEPDALLTRTLINSTGLSGPFILNSFLSRQNPPKTLLPMYYAKGSYGSYHGPGVSHVRHLIYPVPDVGTKAHGFVGLGTHLTLDLLGNVRFGPDIEWIAPQGEGEGEFAEDEGALDFWASHLVASEARIPPMYEAVKAYLPNIVLEGLRPDYCGIRPKLAPPGAEFQDFQIRTDWSCEDRGGGKMISLLGIESPGLTGSLAAAEMVVEEFMQ